MCGMVWLAHGIGVATNDSPQVALALAFVGLNAKPAIENLKAKIALANVVCYNELHMFFVFVWLKRFFVFALASVLGFDLVRL